MEQLEEISVYDLPNTIMVPDGYDMKTIPDLTRENLEFLMDEHNKLVERVNKLMKVMTFQNEVL